LTSLGVLRSKIVKLQSEVLPQPEPNIAIVFPFACTEEPHGVFGYQRIWVCGSKRGITEPLATDEEISDLTDKYSKHEVYGESKPASSDQFLKQYPTLESWLNCYRCGCGKHGSDGSKPYTGKGSK
jgi:hypothetical protein